MEFLVYVLTLGSFLMVFPYLSEGAKLSMEMQSYRPLKSNLEIKCAFKAEKQVLGLTLHYGDSKAVLQYIIKEQRFQMNTNTRVTLEVTPGTNVTAGSFTFKLKSLSCNDFTWYMCTATDGFNEMKSENKTLQIYPQLRLSSDKSDHRVNEVSVFKCIAIVSRISSPSLSWYKSFISPSTNLGSFIPKEISSDACSRTYESQIRYNISVLDVPQLVLHCQLRGLPAVVTQGNFSIEEMTTIAATISPQAVKAGLDPGSIVGIVLGITATIVLVVLLVWFLVIRPKRLKADGSSKDQGPEPNAKDYQVQDNILYATVDPLKKHNHKSSSSSLVHGPDTNSNSVQDTGTAARNLKPNKQNAFLPSHGDATDNMDEAYELPPPPPPPPPKPHRSPRIEPSNPLHYAELELAVHKSAKRRSEYGQRPNTDYAVISHS